MVRALSVQHGPGIAARRARVNDSIGYAKRSRMRGLEGLGKGRDRRTASIASAQGLAFAGRGIRRSAMRR